MLYLRESRSACNTAGLPKHINESESLTCLKQSLPYCPRSARNANNRFPLQQSIFTDTPMVGYNLAVNLATTNQIGHGLRTIKHAARQQKKPAATKIVKYAGQMIEPATQKTLRKSTLINVCGVPIILQRQLSIPEDTLKKTPRNDVLAMPLIAGKIITSIWCIPIIMSPVNEGFQQPIPMQIGNVPSNTGAMHAPFVAEKKALNGRLLKTISYRCQTLAALEQCQTTFFPYAMALAGATTQNTTATQKPGCARSLAPAVPRKSSQKSTPSLSTCGREG